MDQDDEISEQSADEAEQKRPVDAEETGKYLRLVMLELQAEVAARLGGFRILRDPEVNQRFHSVAFRLDPARDGDHPSAEPEEEHEVEERDGGEGELLHATMRQRHVVVKPEKVENAEDDELEEVVEQVDREAPVDDAQRVVQLVVNSPYPRHESKVEVLPNQQLIRVLKSLVDCEDDEHVTNLVTQVGRDVDAGENSSQQIHVLDVDELRTQTVIDVDRDRQKAVVECSDRQRYNEMLSVIDIDSHARQVVIDDSQVVDNFLMMMTHGEVDDSENCRHEERLLDEDFDADLQDDRRGCVADVDFRALD